MWEKRQNKFYTKLHKSEVEIIRIQQQKTIMNIGSEKDPEITVADQTQYSPQKIQHKLRRQKKFENNII